jgi:hypothetical protein
MGLLSKEAVTAYQLRTREWEESSIFENEGKGGEEYGHGKRDPSIMTTKHRPSSNVMGILLAASCRRKREAGPWFYTPLEKEWKRKRGETKWVGCQRGK